ncbi:hypothetical protein PHYSODRAFT_298419 [Phytophthora sojae]|uniref:Uncharacterized protein n=1 Tax=Phytophthora sojae (strain P6497) TaxID=1094619 RepID=G4Z554_PHYSP|nr:hypothetical protein PHYSODRAFT_298419 [Phytophthora sojae]EGZ20197.1 hypothetical protein PHYSODRAFT_298419 [Phytophthora sojae]|eukprot:XP_009522914.1 hypothetical protein PHYSODRAFT_298419 [Phytophthora sojae]
MGQGKHKAKRGKLAYLSIPSGGASSRLSVSRISEPEDEWVFRVDDVTSGGAAFVAGIRTGDHFSTFQWATAEKKPWDADTLEALENPDSESDGFAIVSICKKYPLGDDEKEFQKYRDSAIQKKQVHVCMHAPNQTNNEMGRLTRCDVADAASPHGKPRKSSTNSLNSTGKTTKYQPRHIEKPRLKKPKRAFNGSDCDSESSEWDSCVSSLGPCEKDDEDDDEEEGGDQLLQQEGGDGEEDDEEESKGDSNAPEILAAELWGPAQGLMPPEVEEVLNPRHQSGSPAPLNTSSPAEVPPPPVAAPPTAEAVLLQVIKEAKNYSGAISSSSEWTSRLFDLLGVSTGSFLEQLGRPSPADFVGLLEQTVKPLAEWSSLAGQDDGDMAASINRIVDAATLLPSKASAEVNVEPTMEQIRTLEADVESTSDPDRAKLRRIKAEEKDMEVCMKITGLLSAQRERIDCYDQMITERQGCCHTVVVPATPGGSEVARETCTRANEKATKLSEDLFYASSSVLGVMDDQSRDLVYKFTFEQQVSTLRCKAAEL